MLRFMGSNDSAKPGLYVGQLVDHASKLHRAARRALEAGDYARAAALIDDAELLAADVHELVDAIEARGSDALAALSAPLPAFAPAPPKPRKPFFALPPRRVRAALGTSIAVSLALTEC